MEIRYRLLKNEAGLPERGTELSAGYDLRSSQNYTLRPNETAIIPTGLALEIPKNHFGMICSRSGLAAKHSVIVLNAPGIIDADYRGEIKCILHNFGLAPFEITRQMKIAQLILMPFLPIEWVNCSALSDSKRGENGFGSTGY